MTNKDRNVSKHLQKKNLLLHWISRISLIKNCGKDTPLVLKVNYYSPLCQHFCILHLKPLNILLLGIVGSNKNQQWQCGYHKKLQLLSSDITQLHSSVTITVLLGIRCYGCLKIAPDTKAAGSFLHLESSNSAAKQ